MSNLSKRHLLADDMEDVRVECGDLQIRPPYPNRFLDHIWSPRIAFVGLLGSIVLNAVLLSERHPGPSNEAAQRSPYTDLAHDTPIVFQSSSEFSGNNHTLVDELWDSIDVSPVTVALSDEWARGHDLEPSLRFPWDEKKGLYFLKVFHSLHCLKLIRRAFIDFERGNKQLIGSLHVYHCLDALRQDISCKADDTPMPASKPTHGIGDKQIMQCKNLSKLVTWTQQPERQACYNHIDDYRTVAHSLEKYAFCPKDSKYFPVMKAYFDKHGHKKIFEEK